MTSKLQPASLDIYDTKYRLKTLTDEPVDADIDATFDRVAEALANIEEPEKHDHWRAQFRWALDHGAIPAGRIVSNAGAEAYKPGTSLINCFGAGTPVLTKDGIKPIETLVGRRVEVLNGAGEWSEVEFQHHGKQRTYTMQFFNADTEMVLNLRSTAEHRWVPAFKTCADKDLTTAELMVYIVKNDYCPVELAGFDPETIGSDNLEASNWGVDFNLSFEQDGFSTQVEDVYCCEEPKTHAFCLAGGLLTGNCTVSQIVDDSIDGIYGSVHMAAKTLAAGCGIGYEFSTLRPKDAFVGGAGARTSGMLSFMDSFDAMCFTIASAGGRRGAQMGTCNVHHPDIEEFIKVKREDGRLRQFNLSVLITDEFVEAVTADGDWPLSFPVMASERRVYGDVVLPFDTVWRKHSTDDGYVWDGDLCEQRVYKVVKARELWDTIMHSTYDFAEPGFILVDRINELNNNWFCETITGTNPCAEQPLPPNGACLLGSINLTKFVKDPFTKDAAFDWDTYKQVIRIFTRMLDNVVEINGLPLEAQREEIRRKRRHGMGYLGLGSALAMLGVKYGSKEAVAWTEEVTKVLAIEGWREGVALAKEKGPAPIFDEVFKDMARYRLARPNNLGLNPPTVSGRELFVLSKYMENIFKEDISIMHGIQEHGCRFTHHSSIAPTGTISLSLGNNASNGIEPSFAHHYKRNVIKEGKKTKEQVDVFSYELLAYREHKASELRGRGSVGFSWTGPDGETVRTVSDRLNDPEDIPTDWLLQNLPDSFTDANIVTPKQHVDMQAAAQKWIDSSISKTINVATEIPFDEFEDIYLYAHKQGLKGCTTFRYNPEAFSGVLVKDEELAKTRYRFTLDSGEVVELAGNEEVAYDGQMHVAANLHDAIKEGYYGKH